MRDSKPANGKKPTTKLPLTRRQRIREALHATCEQTIRDRMLAASITASELADRMKRPQDWLLRRLSGKKLLSMRAMARILNALTSGDIAVTLSVREAVPALADDDGR